MKKRYVYWFYIFRSDSNGATRAVSKPRIRSRCWWWKLWCTRRRIPVAPSGLFCHYITMFRWLYRYALVPWFDRIRNLHILYLEAFLGVNWVFLTSSCIYLHHMWAKIYPQLLIDFVSVCEACTFVQWLVFHSKKNTSSMVLVKNCKINWRVQNTSSWATKNSNKKL